MPNSLEPPQEEMQKDTSLPSPSGSLAATAGAGSGRQAGTSGSTNRSEPGNPKTCRMPTLSKVILRILEDKGINNRVSLTTLKKAVAVTGYNMTRNAWRFKMVVKRLVEKGVLRQVTGKGSSGSFCVGRKYNSKLRRKVKKQRRHRKPSQRSGQRQSRKAKMQVGSKQGLKRVAKGARGVARRCCCGH